MTVESIRVFGAPDGAAGVQVRESIGSLPPAPVLYGTSAFVGSILKRGPMGIPFPLRDRAAYDRVFGKPGDPYWHLYDNPNESSVPDAIDGFFANSRNTSSLWLIRNELEGARKASKVFYSRSNESLPVLKVTASNEGKWGGAKKAIMSANIISITRNTFVVRMGNISANELVGGTVEFKTLSGSKGTYNIKANTKSNANQLVTCAIETGVDIQGLGVDSNEAITGSVSYEPWAPLLGTFSYSPKRTLTGTINLSYNENSEFLLGQDLNGRSVVVKGIGTSFADPVIGLKVGDRVYIGNEMRTVVYVWDNNLVSIDTAFQYATGSGLILEADNYEIVVDSPITTGPLEQINQGTPNVAWNLGVADDRIITLKFNDVPNSRDILITAKIVGQKIFIVKDPEAELNRTDIIIYPLPDVSFTNQPLTYLNYWIEEGADDTAFGTELAILDDALLDPRSSGKTVLVAEVIADGINPEKARLLEPFSGTLLDSPLVKFSSRALFRFDPPVNNGVSVVFGNGSQFPDTHFSVEVYFEGTKVFNAPDVSLNPNDPFYLEQSVNQSNIAYRDDGIVEYTWIYLESLLVGDYKTNKDSDMRPANARGKIVAFNNNKNTFYYFGASDKDYKGGSVQLYLDPYKDPRRFVRAKGDIVKSQILENATAIDFSLNKAISVTVTGANVTATVGVDLRQYYEEGDYFYDSRNGELREVVRVSSSLVELASAPTGGNGTNLPIYLLGKFTLEPERYNEIKLRYDNDAEWDKTFFMSYFTDLEDGYDGDSVNVTPSQYTRYFDIERNYLEKAALGKNQGMIRIATPGVNDLEVQLAGVAYAARKAYEYRAEIPTRIVDAISAERYVLSELGRSDFLTVAYPSYATVSDPRTGADRFVPLSGDIMGYESLKASGMKGYQNIAAGFSVPLRRVKNLPVYLDPFNDEPILNQVGIQPITRKSGQVLIFGANSPSESAIYKQTHIRRNQSQYIRIFAESAKLYSLLFRVYTPGWEEEIMFYLRSFFEAERNKGAISQTVAFSSAVRIERTAGESLGNGGNDVYLSLVDGKVYINISYIPSNMVDRIIITMNPENVISRVA